MPDPEFILVVDDEPDMLRLLSRLIDGAFPELDVLSAPDGQAALAALERPGCRILITDFRMPGMDGLELASRVAQHDADIKRVLLTAFVDSGFVEEAQQSGQVDAVFKKPVAPEQLVATIRDLLAS